MNFRSIYMYLIFITGVNFTVVDSQSALPRPQASLSGRVRWALHFGIDSTRFAGRCGTDANGKGEPLPIYPRAHKSMSNRLDTVKICKQVCL